MLLYYFTIVIPPYTCYYFIGKNCFDDDNDNGRLVNHLNQTSFSHDNYSEME